MYINVCTGTDVILAHNFRQEIYVALSFYIHSFNIKYTWQN